ncbi:hypothetical protein FHL15_009972 [Xylaria flabelliformis]|uniref:Uncharacterized protein n=1 Tax=Xylaria flabelliformis TaxID=2512241 RepID=A0A553HMH8_9PEZI|nr:hypothetical protein FHL15_009972 [Xylaria flabelliformis]
MSSSNKPQKENETGMINAFFQQNNITFPLWAASHLTNYNPRDLAANVIADDVEMLWGEIYNWVFEFLDPIIDQANVVSSILGDIRNNETIAKHFYQVLSENRDFISAIKYPETEFAVLETILMRFLVRRIFEGGMLDKNKQPYRLLQALETSVSNNQKEAYHDLTVQLWRHTTYRALLNMPDFSSIWKQYTDETMTYLRQLLECFRAAPHFESSLNKFEATILAQACKIHRDMVMSMDKYSFHIETYDQPKDRRARVDSLLSSLDNDLQIKDHTGPDRYLNVLQYMKSVKIRDIDRTELYEKLDPLCNVKPRLRFRTLGQRQDRNHFKFGPEKNITATSTLVVYGDDAKKRKVLKTGSSLFSRICKAAAR